MDDEYARAGVRDPKVCVTTSRDPSSRLKQFAKEMKLVVPNAQRINRGNHKVRVVRIVGYPACHEHGLLEDKSLHLGKITTQLKQQGRRWLLEYITRGFEFFLHRPLLSSGSHWVGMRQPEGIVQRNKIDAIGVSCTGIFAVASRFARQYWRTKPFLL